MLDNVVKAYLTEHVVSALKHIQYSQRKVGGAYFVYVFGVSYSQLFPVSIR